jgi:hypothetical protein
MTAYLVKPMSFDIWLSAAIGLYIFSLHVAIVVACKVSATSV